VTPRSVGDGRRLGGGDDEGDSRWARPARWAHRTS
jgi:hypothetical protein